MTPNVYVTDVSPVLASEWMCRNTTNRPLKQHVIDRYSRSMAEGNWKLNGESIKFSDDGRLIDGQHRLSAVIKSGAVIKMVVVKNIASDSFDTIDTGRYRGPKDTFALLGYKYVNLSASITRLYLGLTNQVAWSVKPTNAEYISCINNHPIIHEWAHRVGNDAKARSMLYTSVIAVLVRAQELYGIDEALGIYRAIVWGENVGKGNPAYELREKIIARRAGSKKFRYSDKVLMALSVKAVNAWVTGNPIALLKYAANEDFPKFADV